MFTFDPHGQTQMYVMGEKVGHSVLPVQRPGADPAADPRNDGMWKENTVKPIVAGLVDSGAPYDHQVCKLFCTLKDFICGRMDL